MFIPSKKNIVLFVHYPSTIYHPCSDLWMMLFGLGCDSGHPVLLSLILGQCMLADLGEGVAGEA